MADEPSRMEFLAELASEMSQAGLYAAALGIVEEIDSSALRDSARANVALSQAHAGDSAAARQTLEGLVQDSARASALKGIAEGLARADKSDLSRATFEEALASALRIEDKFGKVEVLKEIALALVRVDERETARTTLAAAADIAQTIHDEQSRSDGLHRIASVLARSGFGKEAVCLARTIPIRRNVYLPMIASALVGASDKEGFKLLVLLCADYLDAAYAICGLLAELYPEQAMAVAEVVTNT